jgi:hypothetical protein
MSKIEPIGETHQGTWQRVTTITAFPTQALVYEVRATDGNGNPVDVVDDGKVDHEGTMYIGEQTDDVKRFENLIRGFQSGGKHLGHDAPMKYFRDGWDKKYPLADLEACVTLMVRQSAAGKSFTRSDGTAATEAPTYTATDGKVAATAEECRRLNAKEHKIGRLPPLNSKGGGRIKKAALPAIDPTPGNDIGIEEGDDPYAKLAELRQQQQKNPSGG